MKRILLALLLVLGATAAAANEYILRTSPAVAGASVFVDGAFTGTTDDNGKIALTGAPGPHQIRVEHEGASYTAEMVFDTDLTALPPFTLNETQQQPAPAGAQTVDYTIDTNVEGAGVEVSGEAAGTTDSAGQATLHLVAGRQYTIVVSKSGFDPQTSVINVPNGHGQLSVALQRKAGAEHHVDGLLIVLSTFLAVSIVLLLVVAMRYRRVTAAPREADRLASAGGEANAGHFDRYQLAGTLGSGGIGTIYRALDLVDKSMVALKVLDARWLSDPDMVRKFLAEGETLQAITRLDPHAAVVRCFRYGREHESLVGRPFIALELLEGETLQTRLAREPVLDPFTCAAVAYQLAAALVPVHAAGVVHRDLTPDNIFLRRGDAVIGETRVANVPAVVLIDFGIARQELMSRMTMDGSIAGKPHFMSPEQCRGLVVDARSDLYSLGIVLYLMAAGKLPFAGRDPFEVMRAQQADDPPPLPQGVDSRYAELCSRLLRKDRNARPESAAAAASELYEVFMSAGASRSVNVVSFPNRRVSL